MKPEDQKACVKLTPQQLLDAYMSGRENRPPGMENDALHICGIVCVQAAVLAAQNYHRDAQPAVAVNQRMRTALQEIANTVNYAQWYQETAEKALEDANHTEVALDKVAAVAVNEQLLEALKLAKDELLLSGFLTIPLIDAAIEQAEAQIKEQK